VNVFGATVCKTVRPMLSDRCPVCSVCLPCLSVCLSVCDVGVLWPNGGTDQDKTWHAGRPRPWQHYVRWGPTFPSPKGGIGAPQFLAHTCCGQMAAGIKMPLGMEVGFSPATVLDGDPARFPQKGGGPPPKFSAHVNCGQTAGWIKIVVGMEVGLSQGNFMSDGDPSRPQKGARAPSPIFGPCRLWPYGWMHQDTTWYGVRPHPRGFCVPWGPSPLLKKGPEPPIFGPCLLRPNACMD